MKKLLIGLGLILSCTASAGTWCAYSEFIRNNNPRFKEMTGDLRVRALQCQGQPGGLTITKPDGKQCTISNATVGNNLVNIADAICQKDQKICRGAYNSLKVWNPDNLKQNPAFDAIFKDCAPVQNPS